MYSRDPFNLRRKNSPGAANIFRPRPQVSTFRETLSEASETARAAVANVASAAAATMTSSYGLPSGTGASAGGGTLAGENIWQPANGNSNSSSTSRSRHQTHTYANGGAGGGMGQAIGDTFTVMMNAATGKNDSLPYYKDKPYQHPSKGRGNSPLPRWLLKRRTYGVALGSFMLLLWWLGAFSSSHSKLPKTSAGLGTTSGKPAAKSWFSSGGARINWDERAELVKDTFKLSWAGYEKHGWGYDEYHPASRTGKFMSPAGLGWIIVDAIDTMMLMNLTTELTHARQWLHTNLTYDQNQDVNTFETTIRMMGGLLSAHYLSSAFPGRFAPVEDNLGDDMYVEKAADLADRLLAAYETKSGVPLASVNLHRYQGIPSHADGGASSTAEATTLQLEMKYLAKLTGEVHYWEQAEKVMKVIDDLEAPDGLVPIFIYADRGTFRGNNIRLGSRGDSYYEYLIKQYLQTSNQEPIYQAMWNESLAGVKKHLITYSSPDNFTVLAERPNGLDNLLSPKMDHLVCFMPGTIALATTGGSTLAKARAQKNWGPKQDEDFILAEELMKTCMGMYAVTPTGLAPEIAHFTIHDPPLMYDNFSSTATRPRATTDFASIAGHANFQIHAGDVHNLQRPETVESLFYLWRITRDPIYREWGWRIFQSFVEHTATPDGEGFSSAANVLNVPPGLRDNMESFWLAETLKYFYLLFKEEELLPLEDVVFNTEAHPFPRFELGKLFKTGWKRKQDLTPEERKQDEARKQSILAAAATQTVTQTQMFGVNIPTAIPPEVIAYLATALPQTTAP